MRRLQPGNRTEYTPNLPNSNSNLATPGSRVIDIHYANLLLIERWTWERYTRLCEFLKMTPAELASLCLMPHSWLARYEERNSIPTGAGYSGARSIALILALVEAHAMQRITKDVITNPFPNFNKNG